jgi:hypothetical protein
VEVIGPGIRQRRGLAAWELVVRAWSGKRRTRIRQGSCFHRFHSAWAASSRRPRQHRTVDEVFLDMMEYTNWTGTPIVNRIL